MNAMPNSHLVLHKETLKQHFADNASIKHLIEIINLGPLSACRKEWVNLARSKLHKKQVVQM